jgi:hypothetical protein
MNNLAWFAQMECTTRPGERVGRKIRKGRKFWTQDIRSFPPMVLKGQERPLRLKLKGH